MKEDPEYVKAINKEIDRLKSEGKSFWYDFDVSRDRMLLIINYFSKDYHIELKSCKSCSGDKKYDITIEIR